VKKVTSDTPNHRIQRSSATGTFLGAWGSQGTGDGQFDSPRGVAVAPDGTVYVADSRNSRIQRFSATGTFLGTWGSPGSGNIIETGRALFYEKSQRSNQPFFRTPHVTFLQEYYFISVGIRIRQKTTTLNSALF